MDYEREDRIATKRGRFAAEMLGRRPTVLEAARGLGLDAPVTADDLRTLKAVCRTWGIVTNISDEPVWKFA